MLYYDGKTKNEKRPNNKKSQKIMKTQSQKRLTKKTTPTKVNCSLWTEDATMLQIYIIKMKNAKIKMSENFF